MERPRHWLIGTALGGMVAVTLAVFTDAALPPAAPHPAPLTPPRPMTAAAVSPFGAAVPGATLPAEPADGKAGVVPEAAPPAAAARAPIAELGPDTDELQTLIDELANRPSVDAALDREARELLLVDVRQRAQRLRSDGGPAPEIARLDRMVERLARLP